MLSGLLVVLGVASAQEWPAGTIIENGLAVQITDDGLQELGTLVPGFLPEDLSRFEVDDIEESGLGGLYYFALTNLWASLEIADTRIVPRNGGRLDIEADLLVNINEPIDRFDLTVELFGLGETCNSYVSPFPVTVGLPFYLSVVPDPADPTGQKMILQGALGDIEVDNGLQGSNIELGGCVIQTIEDVLSWFGLSIYQLIIDLTGDLLIDVVAGQLGDLEDTLNEALASASFAEEIDLLGTPLTLNLSPADVQTMENVGIELTMSALFDAPQHECIADYDSGGSPKTDTFRPDINDNDPSASATAHISDDMINQALYAVWRGGALCQDLDADTLQGLPADTSLLTLIGGEAYEEILPEDPAPVIIRTDPKTPLSLDLDGDNDLNVDVRDLELQIFGPIDYRIAKALAVNIEADLGVDLEFDGAGPNATGELAIGLDLEDAFTITVADPVMVPGHEDEIAASFEETLTGLVGTLLDSLLGDSLSFALPAFGENGLVDLWTEQSGEQEDWLAASVELGPVSYGDPDGGLSCDEDGGCSGCESGCEDEGGGCNVVNGATSVWIFALVSTLLRRRRS